MPRKSPCNSHRSQDTNYPPTPESAYSLQQPERISPERVSSTKMPARTQRPRLSLDVHAGPGSQNVVTCIAAHTMRTRSAKAGARLPTAFRDDQEGLLKALTSAAERDGSGNLIRAFPDTSLAPGAQGKAWAKLLLNLADNYSEVHTPITEFRDLLIAEARYTHVGKLIPILVQVADGVEDPEYRDLEQWDI